MTIYIVVVEGETDRSGILRAFSSWGAAEEYRWSEAGSWYSPQDLEIIEADLML